MLSRGKSVWSLQPGRPAIHCGSTTRFMPFGYLFGWRTKAVLRPEFTRLLINFGEHLCQLMPRESFDQGAHHLSGHRAVTAYDSDRQYRLILGGRSRHPHRCTIQGHQPTPVLSHLVATLALPKLVKSPPRAEAASTIFGVGCHVPSSIRQKNPIPTSLASAVY